jgi:hypothetical protein
MEENGFKTVPEAMSLKFRLAAWMSVKGATKAGFL